MTQSKPRWVVKFSTDQTRRQSNHDPLMGWMDGKRNFALQSRKERAS